MKIYYILPKWFNYRAIALCFIILAQKGEELSPTTKNHELIHIAQQKDLWYIPFFLMYFTEFLYNYIFLYSFNWEKAYRNISFEKEAYANESNLNYLTERSFYAHSNYIDKKLENNILITEIIWALYTIFYGIFIGVLAYIFTFLLTSYIIKND